MASLNKAMLIGNLGKNPETKVLESGKSVCNFSVATSETWKDKNTGEKKEKSEWHNIVVFDKLADVCANYLKKGSKVYIEGKIQTRKWTDKNGVDRYTTEIVASEMKMLSSKKDGEQPATKAAPAAAPADDFNDDVPF
jgi:single-strand DNA-binding protein